MDSFSAAVVGLIAFVAAVLAAAVATAVSAALYFGQKAYRRVTRRHLYVPVTGKVTRSFCDFRQLWVSFEHGGREVRTRIAVSREAVRRARRAGIVRLEIDPEFPTDAVLANPI